MRAITCPKPVELSRALVEGIDDDLRAHLATCERCNAEVTAHTAIAAGARRLPVVEPAADRARVMRNALLVAARSPAPSTIRTFVRPRLWFAFATAGALAAAAILAFVLLPRSSSPTYRGTIHAHAGASYVRIGSVPDEIVRLSQGTLTVEVAALSPGERFRVVTSDGEVEVRGTAFDVTADNDHLASVRVLHGRVEVRADGSTQKLLTAGERWDVTLARAESSAKPGPVPGFPARDAKPGPVPGFPARDAKPGPVPSFPPRDSKPGPVPGSHSVTTAAKPATATTSAATSAKPTTATAKSGSAAITTKVPTGSAAPAAPKRPNELLFEQGWAALAAGDTRGAASTFERAAKAAPKDPLAEDAWFWRASALARMKDGSAVRALESFLAGYPRSPRAGEASAMLGWLVIDRDVDRAEALFKAAAQDRVAAVRTSGEKGIAAVAQRRAQ
jgi:TolA-binding protein